MTDKAEHHIPTWDGQAKGWRRYTREVAWFVRSTPPKKRRFCATKLAGRLTSSARLLVMSWQTMDFDYETGTTDFLRRLAQSPLVRQALPNAAAVCEQYFSFRRRHQEPIHQFLVRETLCYSEICEAILRLHEEKVGVVQHKKDFDLPPDTGTDWWTEEMEDEADNEDGDSQSQRVWRRGMEAASFSAGDWRSQARSQSLHSGTGAASASRGTEEAADEPLTELSLADSFVLGVLRGFRLLQAAGLSPEDRRDILGTTRGSLEYEAVTAALQTLWDEQLMGRTFNNTHNAHFNELQAMEEQQAWQDWQDWYDNYQGEQWTDEDWWNYEAAYQQEAHDDTADGTSPPEEDEGLKEAQQAERMQQKPRGHGKRPRKQLRPFERTGVSVMFQSPTTQTEVVSNVVEIIWLEIAGILVFHEKATVRVMVRENGATWLTMSST